MIFDVSKSNEITGFGQNVYKIQVNGDTCCHVSEYQGKDQVLFSKPIPFEQLKHLVNFLDKNRSK
jgi:hypothetical protein